MGLLDKLFKKKEQKRSSVTGVGKGLRKLCECDEAFAARAYKNTEKPDCYVHVDEPKTLQDIRQLQYNAWCRVKGVYCGSYLPENPDALLKKGKGWVDVKSPKNKQADQKELMRKSSGQKVQWHDKKIKHGVVEDEHYHWENPNPDTTTGKTAKATARIDRYGNSCGKESPESHLAPLDRDYNFVKHNKGNKRK